MPPPWPQLWQQPWEPQLSPEHWQKVAALARTASSWPDGSVVTRSEGAWSSLEELHFTCRSPLRVKIARLSTCDWAQRFTNILHKSSTALYSMQRFCNSGSSSDPGWGTRLKPEAGARTRRVHSVTTFRGRGPRTHRTVVAIPAWHLFHGGTASAPLYTPSTKP